MITLPAIANIPARHQGPTRSKGPINLIVIHATESSESTTGAEAIARYFKTMSDGRRASAHYVVDSDSIVRCVQDSVVAWAAPGANHQGLHVELCGRAAQSAQQWSDPYSLSQLHLAAALVASKTVEHDVPVVWLRAAELRAGRSGITSHLEVTNAWHRSTHTDPGKNFPASAFVVQVATLVAADARVLWLLVRQRDRHQNGMIVQPTGSASGRHLAPVQVTELLAAGWVQVMHSADVQIV